MNLSEKALVHIQAWLDRHNKHIPFVTVTSFKPLELVALITEILAIEKETEAPQEMTPAIVLPDSGWVEDQIADALDRSTESKTQYRWLAEAILAELRRLNPPQPQAQVEPKPLKTVNHYFAFRIQEEYQRGYDAGYQHADHLWRIGHFKPQAQEQPGSGG